MASVGTSDMINFFKSMWSKNWEGKVTLISGAAILLIIVPSLIWAIIVRPGDLSFLEREGHQLQWKRGTNISCFYHQAVPQDYVAATLKAIFSIEAKTGLDLFGPCIAWQLPTVPKYAPDDSFMLMLRDEEGTAHGAQTEHRYDKRTGRIISAWVRYDSGLDNLIYKVALHELGHVLGLDHDRERSSIMYPTGIDRPNALSPRDVKSLQKAYDDVK